MRLSWDLVRLALSNGRTGAGETRAIQLGPVSITPENRSGKLCQTLVPQGFLTKLPVLRPAGGRRPSSDTLDWHRVR